MMTKWGFDERQMQIAGKVYIRGFLIAVILLFINGLLQSYHLVWASGFHQNVIMAVMIHTIVSFDAILRGVYFPNDNKTRWVTIGTFGVLSLVLWIITILRGSQGALIFELNTLTSCGFSLVLAIMFTITTSVGIIVELKEKRRDNEQ